MTINEKYMFSAVKISLIGNIILTIIKAITIVIVNSLAVATDLGISLVALAVSVMLYQSVKIAHRPADFAHNYGYGKVEHVCEAIEGIIIIGIALAMSFQALTSLLHPKHVASPMVGFITSAMGIIINTAGGIYIGLMAKRSASPAIRAEAIHYFLEAFISVSITLSFIGIILLHNAGHQRIALYLDPLAALFVSIVICIPSFKLAKEAFFKLLDSSIEESGKMEVVKCLGQYIDRCCEFKDLRTRNSGSKKFIELRIILPQEINFKLGHRVAKRLEKDIQQNIPHSEVRISLEPCLKDCVIVKNGKSCPYLSANYLDNNDAR